MGINSVAFRTAKDLVVRCESEADEIMAHHHQAMECRDCEDFLQLAITAFEWTQRVTCELRARSIRDSESNVEGAIALRGLRDAWVRIATVVLDWARTQVHRGFFVSNLTQLEVSLDRMRHVVAEEDRLAEIACKVPTSEKLSLIAVDPPREWLDEPSWVRD